LAWHKDAVVRIQRIRDLLTILPWPVRQTVLIALKETSGQKESRMITKRVFCESSGHSVARHAAPLLGMSW
jgi:hypothetical protein